MAKVTVVGAGIAGLATALYATTAGHHVVVLERTDRLGGKGTSQTVDGAPFGYGLHLLLHRGPLMKLVKKISRLPLVLSAPRLDRLTIPTVGAIRPRNNVRLAAQHRRALRQGDTASPVAQAASLLAGSGHPDYGSRYVAFNRQRLSFVGEGWSGVVGRMAAALDEVGVLIEANCQVTSIDDGRVQLKDGRAFDSDVVVLACGVQQAKRLLKGYDGADLSQIQPVFASTIDATLDAKPMAELHGIIDPSEGAYVLDSNNIQPRLQLPGAFLSAVMAARDGESEDERMARLEGFLDHHAVGWRTHVLHGRKQTNILVQTQGSKPAYDSFSEHGILLAGEWVASEHRLADAAADTGRLAGQNIAKAQP